MAAKTERERIYQDALSYTDRSNIDEYRRVTR